MPEVTRVRDDGTEITVDAAQLLAIYYLELADDDHTHIRQAYDLMETLGYVDERGGTMSAILQGEHNDD